MASLMTATVWDRLQERALDAVRDGADDDFAARQLLAGAGGDRRMVLATRLRLAAVVAGTPDALEPRRALTLLDRAIAVADAEGLWHPVFSDLDAWQFARHHAAP
jgi:hypothetical protein